GELERSLEIADQLLQMFKDLQDGSLMMEAHRAKGGTLVFLGRCKEALPYLDESLALYDLHREHCSNLFIGRDCKVVCNSAAARALWALGRSEEHTSELQSHLNIVCRLLLEKKKYLK